MLEKAPIDVCIPTKNGISQELYYLIRNDITGYIILDFSTPLTASRMALIKKVETPYFAFLDDDIQYKKGLLRVLYDYIRYIDNAGAVQGRTTPYGLGKVWDDALKPKSQEIVTIEGNDHKRFMTSNVVLKTALVKDWQPKPSYSGCEDWHLTKHILSKGHFALIVPLNVPHLRTWSKIRSNCVWFSKAYINVFGKRGALKYMLKLVLGISKYMVTLPIHTRLSMYTIYQNTAILWGLLCNLI